MKEKIKGFWKEKPLQSTLVLAAISGMCLLLFEIILSFGEAVRYTAWKLPVAFFNMAFGLCGIIGLLIVTIRFIAFVVTDDYDLPWKQRDISQVIPENKEITRTVSQVVETNVIPEEKCNENKEKQTEQVINTSTVTTAASVAAVSAAVAGNHHADYSHYAGNHEYVEPYDEYGERMDAIDFELADEYYDEFGEHHIKDDNIDYIVEEEDEMENGYGGYSGYRSSGYSDPYDDMDDFDDLDDEDKDVIRNETMLNDFIIFNGGDPYDFDDRMDATFDPFGFGDDD